MTLLPGELYVRSAAEAEVEAMREHHCFVIQPYDRGDYDKRYGSVLEPAIRAAGFVPYRVDRNPAVDSPVDDIEAAIRESRVCLADITTDNPNVWYEVGYSLACHKRICLICGPDRNDIPFNVRTKSVIKYGANEPEADLERRITERLKAIIKDERLVHIKGEAEQLLTIYPDGKLGAEKDGSAYVLTSGDVSLGDKFAVAHAELEMTVGDTRIHGSLTGHGPIHNGYAYLTYDASDAENRQSWKGLCLLKLPGFGNFDGYWITESNIVPGTLSFGRMTMERVCIRGDKVGES